MEVGTVPHEAGAGRRRRSRARCGVLLILTASATSDAQDVAPAGLVAAGGRLIRFGMPVDPGNLLVLGALGERVRHRAAGLRALPGAERRGLGAGARGLRCGGGAEDIAAMGVGGLLKEIPTRPQPRDGPGRPS
jgi:molybdenum cofactor cytidylyltransferase